MITERRRRTGVTVRVTVSGLEYEFYVHGYAVRGYRASFTDPGEAGHIEDYSIHLDEVDVTDILADAVHESVIVEAEAALRAEGML